MSSAQTSIVLLALGLALGLSGCATQHAGTPASKDTASPSRTASPDATQTADAHDALTVELQSTGTSCLTEKSPTDLAWFDATWKAHADLDSFSFHLTNPVGIKQVGPVLTVPPVNFGGRIDYAGEASWSGHAKVLDDERLISWFQHDDTDSWTPIEDQSGLLVFHIRLDPKVLDSPAGASFDGVTTTYRDLDGTEHTFTTKAKNAYTSDGTQCRA